MFGFFSNNNKTNTDAQYIFDYIKRQMNSLKKYRDKYEGVVPYDKFAEEILIGYFSYYIAGVYDAHMARKIINICVKEKCTLNRTTIQDSYTMARAISETLMQQNCDADEIIEEHSLSILKILRWEESEINLKVFINLFSDVYKYIGCIYNNKLSSFEESGFFEKLEATDELSKRNETQTSSKEVAPFWNKIIQQLRDEEMPAVASALTGTHGSIIDDLTFEISGVDGFKQMILEKPENMSAIKRLVSLECKKDMQIKFTK